jgi:fructosamine-3-kinase
MSRSAVYYWKCDRTAAFHGTQENRANERAIETQLLSALESRFQKHVRLFPGTGQGNHLTWVAEIAGCKMFIRVEDGPEKDTYLEMESAVMSCTRAQGLPVPEVFAVDVSRTEVPFAWQAIEYIDCPDLNHFYKLGTLDISATAHEIGASVARWQNIVPQGFGPFNLEVWREQKELHGFHPTYPIYFNLRLEEHLDFLVLRGFLDKRERGRLLALLAEHQSLLELEKGCLVHKDLALWNVLGTGSSLRAIIDFDDAISGDPMDDLSLLGCFHDAGFIQRVIEGYTSIRPLPSEHRRRFWMHLVRNMIVKSVIRVGAGYFERSSKFFLIGTACKGDDFKHFTRSRLLRAADGLITDAELSDL